MALDSIKEDKTTTDLESALAKALDALEVRDEEEEGKEKLEKLVSKGTFYLVKKISNFVQVIMFYYYFF